MNTKFARLSLTAVMVPILMLAAFTVASPAGATGQNGTTLSATVDVTPHWTITYGWTIDKSVAPDTLNMFRGDSEDVIYSVTVTKDNGTEAAWVDGQVCVTNGGAVDTETLAITAVLKNGYEPPNDFLASALVDVSGYPVIPAGESHCYAYQVNIPITGGAFPQPHAGGTYKVTANVTITNHSGSLGTPKGPSPSATTVFLASPMLINDTITVSDASVGAGAVFNSSGTLNYTRQFACDGDAGMQGNTAIIEETGQSASASVTVNCYALEVKKDASTSFKRTYNWTIDKIGDQSALTLATGEQFPVNYEVKVAATYTDSDWAVSGNIYINNPAPMDAQLTDVSDIVSPDISADVDCPSLTVPAGGALTCTYSACLLDASTRTNTATATLQNYDVDYLDGKTLSGTTDFSGMADVDFGNATKNDMDECINVSDSLQGALGTVCKDDAPKTFTYTRYVGSYLVCGDYTVDNTASFVANDSGATGSDGWTVNVHVPCVNGCTLTQGYWKTHSSLGPAPYDDTWAQLSNGANTPFFLSGKSWYQVFWTPPAGNAYYNLAHQYMAVRLNILNGADAAAAQATLNSATTLFNTYTPAQVAVLKSTNAVRKQFVNLAAILDSYNNGYIGPGHCSE